MILRTAIALGALMAVGAGGAAVASGAFAPSVDACYRTTTGALRVDLGDGCRVGEQAISLGTAQFYTRQVAVSGWVQGGQYEAVQAMCGPGEVVTGGGVAVASIGLDYTVFEDSPITVDGLEGWQGAVSRPYADPEQDLEFWVTAICASGQSLG